MTVSRSKGDRGYCDMLFSRLVRSRGSCERCGKIEVPFDTAHIIGRSYSMTRCELDNAWCLCRTCHVLVDNWWHEKQALVERTIGMTRYWALVAQARQHVQFSSKAFWLGERERLVELCQQTGIDTRWQVPR